MKVADSNSAWGTKENMKPIIRFLIFFEFLDLITAFIATIFPNIWEVNPVLNILGNNWLYFSLFKIAMTLAAIFIIGKIPKSQIWIAWILIFLPLLGTITNIRCILYSI